MKKTFFSSLFLLSLYAIIPLVSPTLAQITPEQQCRATCITIVNLQERQACVDKCKESANMTGITNPAIGNLGGSSTAGEGSVDEAESGATFLRYFITLWRAFISVGALAVIIIFLWGSIEWITAGGDAAKVSKARDKITQAIIGLILLVGSFVIIAFISRLFFGEQFDILNLTIPGTS